MKNKRFIDAFKKAMEEDDEQDIIDKYEVTSKSVGRQIKLMELDENLLKDAINHIPNEDLRNTLYNMTLAAKTGKHYEDLYEELEDAMSIFKKALDKI